MNFQQCFEILSNRDHEPDIACPCCVENRERRIPQGIEVSFPEELKKLQEILPQLASLETLELVEKIQYIQTLRIQAYQYYEHELNILIDTNTLQDYPALCQKMTEKFNGLSHSIIKIREILISREATEIVKVIHQIQLSEKDKLLYIAAHHLNKMSKKLPEIQRVTGEQCPLQINYVQDKIRECEVAINEAGSELQAIKIDLIESS